MTKAAFGIDGYWLAKPGRTGAAIFGCALARSLKASGRNLVGVFGIETGASDDLREILFFDRFQRAVPSSRRPALLSANKHRLDVGLKLVEVPMTGIVDHRSFDNFLPRFDRVVSGADVFEVAQEQFARRGCLLPLSMPNPPPVMLWTGPLAVRLVGARNIYVIHDVAVLQRPCVASRDRLAVRLLDQCLQQADMVCAISDAARDIISAHSPMAADKLHVVGLPPLLVPGDLSVDPRRDAETIENIFGLKRDDYFLCFGGSGEAGDAFASACHKAGLRRPFVIVGEPKREQGGLASEAVRRETEAALLRSAVVALGQVSHALLLKLIRGARAVIYPKRYGGLALPVSEAIEIGTPVLASEESLLADDVRKLVVSFKLNDPASLITGLNRIEQDSTLRAAMLIRGRRHASRRATEHRAELLALNR